MKIFFSGYFVGVVVMLIAASFLWPWRDCGKPLPWPDPNGTVICIDRIGIWK